MEDKIIRAGDLLKTAESHFSYDNVTGNTMLNVLIDLINETQEYECIRDDDDRK